MRRNRGLRVYIQALQFVSGLCDVIRGLYKKVMGPLLKESCHPSLVNVSLS
jgi:hypothetical protein